MHLLRYSVVVALFAMSGTVVAAEPLSTDSIREINDFTSKFPAMCKEMLRQSLSNLQLKPTIDAAPNLEPLVCACVERRMQNDSHLGLLYTVPLATFRSKYDQNKFMPYFMGKMFSFIMACTAPELERAVDAIDPSKGG